MKGRKDGGDTARRQDELVRRVIAAKYWWPRGVEVDEKLKDLCDRMLQADIGQRLGFIVVAPEDGGPLRNDEVRNHPFMRGFPWHAMYDRRLVVSLASYLHIGAGLMFCHRLPLSRSASLISARSGTDVLCRSRRTSPALPAADRSLIPSGMTDS